MPVEPPHRNERHHHLMANNQTRRNRSANDLHMMWITIEHDQKLMIPDCNIIIGSTKESIALFQGSSPMIFNRQLKVGEGHCDESCDDDQDDEYNEEDGVYGIDLQRKKQRSTRCQSTVNHG
jgi:hypothetical protein